MRLVVSPAARRDPGKLGRLRYSFRYSFGFLAHPVSLTCPAGAERGANIKVVTLTPVVDLDLRPDVKTTSTKYEAQHGTAGCSANGERLDTYHVSHGTPRHFDT
jgi:hypothetical protein